jgi:hypothetical protein
MPMSRLRRLPLMTLLALVIAASLLGGCGLFLPDRSPEAPEKPAATQ